MQLKHNTPCARSSQSKIDRDFLRHKVEIFSFIRAYGTEQNELAEAMVKSEFERILGSCFTVGTSRNICFGNPKNARILIGAHYDSVPGSPGADDNASAVAVLLAVAQVLGAQENVFYVAFNAEECGLQGSKEFVDEMHCNMPFLEVAHILEMLGYTDSSPHSQRNPLPGLALPDTADFLGLASNQGWLIDQLIADAAHACIPVVGFSLPEGMPLDGIRQVSPHLLRSDHVWFWNKNIPAIMWTDTSEFRNPHYHLPGDLPDTLDYGFMSEVASLLTYSIQEHLRRPKREQIRP